MAYHSKKYAKFSMKEKVLFESKEDIIENTHLDLTNDCWTYRLKNNNKWVNEDKLEKIVIAPIIIKEETMANAGT